MIRCQSRNRFIYLVAFVFKVRIFHIIVRSTFISVDKFDDPRRDGRKGFPMTYVHKDIFDDP